MFKAVFLVLFFSIISGSVVAKEFKIISSAEVGGSYDLYSRVLARHIGQYLPEYRNTIVQNMPGAGGIVAANYMYNVATKDGSVIAGVHRAVLHADLLGIQNVNFIASKFEWIGSISDGDEVCLFLNKTGINTIEDLKLSEILVGSSGPNNTQQYPNILNNILGTKLKIISGYKSAPDINLAMDRGEIMGHCGVSWDSVIREKQDWISEKRVSVVAQFSTRRRSDLLNVPLITDLVKNETHKKILQFIFSREDIGRPYIAPPTTQIQPIVDAFNATMKDREFLREAEKLQLRISPMTAYEITKVIDFIYQSDPELIQQVSNAVKTSN
jgi:hypothetical protein